MNSMWGSMAQHEIVHWPWPIAVYLFLAGLSAGSMLVALLVKWNRHEHSTNSIWDAMVKAGALIAPSAIILGLGLLVLDLGKPLSFFWLLVYYNPTSVMSIGVIILLCYTPLTLLFTLMIFEENVKQIQVLRVFLPLITFVRSFSHRAKELEYFLFAFALAVGAYTGFLLSAIQALPMWNNPILPILFLTSGISAGIASNILVGLLFFKSSLNPESVKYLLVLDMRAVMSEIPLLIMLFIGMFYGGEAGVLAAKSALTQGHLAWIFWCGVVGIGLLTPLTIAFTALRNHAYRMGFIVANSMIVLLGVFLLRYYIVYAGQTFTGV
ncbi:MAG: polysulfide reductase NrfD [Campylobacterales bacterium]|nr:polysulfide reductase NrfD [Campylobacterales bacterium]